MTARKDYAHCYWCNAKFKELEQLRYSHRAVFFCSRACFRAYLDQNRPVPKLPIDAAPSVAERAAAKLESLKQEVLWHPPNSQLALTGEILIFELTEIIEGRPRVTFGERHVGEPPCSPVPSKRK